MGPNVVELPLHGKRIDGIEGRQELGQITRLNRKQIDMNLECEQTKSIKTQAFSLSLRPSVFMASYISRVTSWGKQTHVLT